MSRSCCESYYEGFNSMFSKRGYILTISIHNLYDILASGFKCAGSISKEKGCNRFHVYKDIIKCYYRYQITCGQYRANQFFWLSSADREELGEKLKTYNKHRRKWDLDFAMDKQFNLKYGSKQNDIGLVRIRRKVKAYNKKYGGGPHFRYVGDSVIIKKQHYLDGQLILGNHICVSRDVLLDITGFLEIQDDVDISEGTKIYTHKHDIYKLQHLIEPNETQERTVIGKGTWIGANSLIMPGVTIGEYAVIGAGSVVTKDIPAYTVYAGNPAKYIRENKTN